MTDTMEKIRNIIAAEILGAVGALDVSQMQAAVREVLNADRIFCDGLGRSGLAMRGFAMRLGQMGKESTLVGEATAPAFKKGDLLFLCTASGSSPTLLYHAQRAKSYGGRILLLTGKTDSALSVLSDSMILIQAPDKDQEGAEKGSIQPMGSLFEQTAQLVCDMMAVRLMEELQLTSEEMRKHHANIE